MEIIDLSRELLHRTQTHPSHPPVIMTVWNDHLEKKVAGDTVFTSKALSIALSDHAGTHVDAPVHFDPRPGAQSIDQVPLANFITSTFCIDLSHVPLKHAASVAEVEAAVKQSGQDIRKGDTVLILLGTNARLLGKPSYGHALRRLSVGPRRWLAYARPAIAGCQRWAGSSPWQWQRTTWCACRMTPPVCPEQADRAKKSLKMLVPRRRQR